MREARGNAEMGSMIAIGAFGFGLVLGALGALMATPGSVARTPRPALLFVTAAVGGAVGLPLWIGGAEPAVAAFAGLLAGFAVVNRLIGSRQRD